MRTPMQPSDKASKAYVAAFCEIVSRIAQVLPNETGRGPVTMYVAGGAAMYLYTGARVSEDVDAVFSHRIALPQDLEVSYLDESGAAHLLYFDFQYNDTFGLQHDSARSEALLLNLAGLDASRIEVRLLAPADLAVSKLAQLADHDRADIETLAKMRLIEAGTLRVRAEEALANYVGEISRVRNSINIACHIVSRVQAPAS